MSDIGIQMRLNMLNISSLFRMYFFGTTHKWVKGKEATPP